MYSSSGGIFVEKELKASRVVLHPEGFVLGREGWKGRWFIYKKFMCGLLLRHMVYLSVILLLTDALFVGYVFDGWFICGL